MKIFRKQTVEDEQVKQAEQKQEQQPDESYGESESIPVFKGQGKRKGAVPDKGKGLHSPKHGQA